MAEKKKSRLDERLSSGTPWLLQTWSDRTDSSRTAEPVPRATPSV